MKENMIKRINDLSIKYKLFLTYLVIIVIPFSLFIFINSYVTSKDSEKQAIFSSRRIFDQTASFLEDKTIAVKNVSDLTAFDDTIQRLLRENSSYYKKNVGNWIVDEMEFTKVAYRTYRNSNIINMHLYMRDGLAVASETNTFIKMNSIEKTEWYKRMDMKGTVFQWFPEKFFSPTPSERYISLIRRIPSAENINEYIGVLRVDVQERIIADILEQAVFTNSTSVLLINSNNELISASRNNRFTDLSSVTDVINTFNTNNSGKDILSTVFLNNLKFLLRFQEIKNSDWKLILLIPYKDILALNTKTQIQMILIVLILAPLTLPLAFFVASSSTKSIRRLINNMRKVVGGNFDVSILPSSNDEIGQLTQNFNYMLTKISILVDDKFRLGKEMKSMELKALQAQINPHFLYNTLDMINWMSVKHGAPQIWTLVQALSQFYKLSLSKGEDIISIRSEVEHITAYVQIQNIRYKDKITLEINIPEELYNCKVLKIILQPIVENSILHGIFEKDEDYGTIAISAEMVEKDIIIYVKDDGIGIPEEKLKHILTGTSTKDSHGYGVKNIHERISLYYGSDYGLTYKSKEGLGTTVEIKIPAVKTNPANL